MTLEFIRHDMAKIAAHMNKRQAKYRRNYNRYANNGRRSEDIWQQYGMATSFMDQSMREDVGTTPNLNIIKSAINTHISKMSATKVRPFFNPMVGTFKTRKVCRQAQQYFDEFFEAQDVYRKSIECMRFADIFELGCMWVDDENRDLLRIAPWEFYFDAAELNFGKMTRCFILQKQFPLIYLKDKLKGEASDYAAKLEEDPSTKVERTVYYDLEGGKKYTFVDAKLCGSPSKYASKMPPVALLYLEEPLKGAFSCSMADDLYTIQAQVDSLCERIHLAMELSPANTIWVPEGSEVKASMLSNEIGAVYNYRPMPGMTGTPVFVSTPPAIDPQYLSMLEFWVRQGFEITGISQLSAMAKKPSGLNSGVALQTVEDVESDRHNLILQAYIRFLMNIAKICIEVFPPDEEILPNKTGRADIKWRDIKKERDSFSIQFSATSSLSKDPKTKMEQIEKLIAMKILNPSLAASMLEFPDLENAYSITSASYDNWQRVIERAVEDGEYDFYEVGDLAQGYREASTTLLQLDANDEKPETLERIVKLMSIIKGKMDAVNAASAPPVAGPGAPPEQMKPPSAPGPTGPLPVSAGPTA
jgi:hypothetical protein